MDMFERIKKSTASSQYMRYSLLGMLTVGLSIVLIGCSQAKPQEITVATAESTFEIVLPSETPTLDSTIAPTVKPEATPKPPNVQPGKIGHIKVDNTKVDYPIMLASDNEYYLRVDENGKRNKGRGSIFAD